MFLRTGIRRLCERVSQYKESSPLLHLAAVIVSLYTLAYVGALFSGFFLTYIFLLVVFMIPGLHRYCLQLCARVVLQKPRNIRILNPN